MPEFVRVWGNNGIREVPVIQGVQEILGSRAITGSTGPQIIATSSIPFLIMPGDGSANGCQFTGSGGAFTLSAAIISGIGTSLAGCYAYFSANFGGSSLPAGWYWTEFSSDTAGIVYANTYTSGKPTRPVTKTAISPSLTGWITGTTNEITGPTGFVLDGSILGKNGLLQTFYSMAASTAGTHSYRGKLDTTNYFVGGNTTFPVSEMLHTLQCLDSHTEKLCSRNSNAVSGGVGVSSGSYTSAAFISIDTSAPRILSFSLQQSTNVAWAVLMRAVVIAIYGE